MDYDDRSPEDIELDTLALDEAIGAGKLNDVLRCIPLADPTYLPQALWWAATCGFTEAVTALIAVCDPTTDNSRALSSAAGQGYIHCVRVLVPVSDPRDYSLALFDALINEQHEVVELLCPLSNLEEAIFHLQHHPYQYASVKKGVVFFEEYQAQEQRKRLSAEITEEHMGRTKKL